MWRNNSFFSLSSGVLSGSIRDEGFDASASAHLKSERRVNGEYPRLSKRLKYSLRSVCTSVNSEHRVCIR